MDEILIAYATKHGSTHEVAEAVAAHLARAGVEAHTLPANRVRSLDEFSLARYAFRSRLAPSALAIDSWAGERCFGECVVAAWRSHT